MSLLHTSLQVGALLLPNRVIMAPLTRTRALSGRVPHALNAEYYAQRAGAGLIISEATSVDPMGVGYPDTPGIWSAEQVAGWRLVTDAVHQRGGRIVLQLWHVGRVSDPVYLNGALPVAPSAVAPSGHVSLIRPEKLFATPRALERHEIPDVVAAYQRGAENAQRAGFDGVEIHGANGYLLDQFLQDSTNLRTDDYGGSLQNRARLMLEVVDAVCSVWGADRVGLHLAPKCDAHGMGDSDAASTFTYLASQAGQRKLAFLCARESYDGTELGPELKRAFGGVYIANQGFTAASAEAAISAGTADAVAWGKAYIANPDLAERLAIAAPLNEPNPATFYGSGPEGYTDQSALTDL
jgi:2,4-dienoyl-CoA reductase-like NADH-dependent reductase (Old Yellow Enzyme family)